VGMALVGLSIGGGRDAYRSASGQLAAVVAVAMVIACWLWSGRIMRLPEEERVFHG
jgi:tight adherence protein B